VIQNDNSNKILVQHNYGLKITTYHINVGCHRGQKFKWSPDDVSRCLLSHWPALAAWYWPNIRRPLPEVPDRRSRLVQVTAKTEYHNIANLHTGTRAFNCNDFH